MATTTPTNPLDLISKYPSAIGDPVDYEDSLLSKEAGNQVHTLYDQYVEQRAILDKQFWNNILGCSETEKSALASKMQTEPAFEKLKAFDSIRIV